MTTQRTPSPGGYKITRPYRVNNSHLRPKSIETGTLAWLLHRITGIFLVVYMLIHIVVVGQGARGQEAFNTALAWVQQPLFVFLDAGLAGVVAFHALNGLRLVSFDVGWGIRWQKPLFWISLVASALIFLGSLWVVRDLL